MKKKISEEDLKASKLSTKKKEFEKSIMIAVGISFYGLSDLMLHKGTMNDRLPWVLIFFKEN